MTVLQTVFYDVTRKMVAAFARFFYWRIRIRGFNRNKMRNRPIMFVSNHQNALMDPLHLPCYTPLRPSFLTRADVFVPPVMDKILYSLKMLPIFRQRDGVASPRKNKVIFSKCIQLLEDKESILIFPEGSHDIRRRMRPLKKGFANILFQAESKNDWTLDSLIIPVMVNYEEHAAFGKDVVVLFGEPMVVKDYKELYETDPVKARTTIAKDLRNHMIKGLIQLDPVEHFEPLSRLYESSQEIIHGRINQPYKRFVADKSFFDKLNAFLSKGGVEATTTIQQIKDYFLLKDQLGLTGLDLSDRAGFFKVFARIVILLLTLPLYGIGLICNYLPYQSGKLVANGVKDPCFKSTAWFVSWMIGTFVYHPILILLFMNSVSNRPLYVLLFWLGILFSGRIAMWWWKLYSKLVDQFKVLTKKRDTSFQILKEMQTRLKRRFTELGLLSKGLA